MSWILSITTLALLIWGFRKKSKAKEAIETLESTLKNLEFLRKENAQISIHIADTKEALRISLQANSKLEKEIIACGCRVTETEEVKEESTTETNLEDSEAAGRTGRMPFFSVFTGKDGSFRWNFKAKNNKIVADSGEGYTTKQNVEKGLSTLINSIKNEDYKIKFKK